MTFKEFTAFLNTPKTLVTIWVLIIVAHSMGAMNSYLDGKYALVLISAIWVFLGTFVILSHTEKEEKVESDNDKK